MRKHLFTEPSHRPQAGIFILCGLFIIALSFGFSSDGATNSRISFLALGLSFVLIGGAEFLPRHAKMIAGIARILAYLSIGIASILVILLWVGIHL